MGSLFVVLGSLFFFVQVTFQGYSALEVSVNRGPCVMTELDSYQSYNQQSNETHPPEH